MRNFCERLIRKVIPGLAFLLAFYYVHILLLLKIRGNLILGRLKQDLKVSKTLIGRIMLETNA
jgi:hypothetical protein